jgi:hypothetical protein
VFVRVSVFPSIWSVICLMFGLSSSKILITSQIFTKLNFRPRVLNAEMK